VRLLSGCVLLLAAAVIFAAQLVARAVEGHVRVLNQTAGGDRFPDHPGELLTGAGWVAVVGFSFAGLAVIVWEGSPAASRPAADLSPEPVGPDDTSAPVRCLACGATIPAGSSRCPVCGWTYAARGSNPAEPGAATDSSGK
jgi:hypothetical protein